MRRLKTHNGVVLTVQTDFSFFDAVAVAVFVALTFRRAVPADVAEVTYADVGQLTHAVLTTLRAQRLARLFAEI